MRAPSNFALGFGLALGSISAAWAGAGTLTTSVTPLSGEISYTESATDPIYIVYAVSVRNDGGNTINNIVFTGATTVLDSNGQPTSSTAKFDSASGATCTTTNADRTAIRCSIGQFKAGDRTLFYVAFVSPEAVAGAATTAFSGTTYYAEGTGGLETSVPQNSTVGWNAESVSLGTTSPKNIKSGVPQVNRTLKFFTAPNVVDPTLDDQITTTVSVPGTAPITATLDIQEAALSTDNTDCIAQGNFYRCYTSTLTIEDTFTDPPTPLVYSLDSGKYLGITLRIDPAAIKPGFKPSNVRVFYDGNQVNACQVTSPSSAATVTYAALPCYTSIVYYKKWNKNVSWPQAWEGAVDVFVINNKNGLWSLR